MRISNGGIVSYPNPQGNHNIAALKAILALIVSYPNPQGNHNNSIS